MEKTLLGFIIVILLFSCRKQNPQEIENMLTNMDMLEETYVLLVEDALSEMYSISALIPPFAKTQQKTGSSLKDKKIKTIETVYYSKDKREASQIRKSGTASDALLYLVNFETDGGYAVLAADTRIPSVVLAITESGSISSEDFMRDYGTFSEEDELDGFQLYNVEENDTYVGNIGGFQSQLMTEYAQRSVKEHTDALGNSPQISPIMIQGDWEHSMYIAPMTRTTYGWHQDDPYNQMFPMRGFGIFRNRKKARIGCVALATAQIIAYHGYPEGLTWGGHYASWDEIRHFKGAKEPSRVFLASTYFLYNVSNGCNSFMTRNWTFAFPLSAKNYMDKLGYRNTKLHIGYNEDRITTMLENGKPVFFASVSGLVNGHAWVIDGLLKRERTDVYKDPSTLAVIGTSTKKETLLWCNWGWEEEKHNGYYASGIFNPGSNNYTWAFHTITYDL